MAATDRTGRSRIAVAPGGPVVLRAAEWKTVPREAAGREVTLRPGTNGVKLSVD
jgi:hypothetical protein